MDNHSVVVVISEEVAMGKVVMDLNSKVTMAFKVIVAVVDVVSAVVQGDDQDPRTKSLFLHQRLNSLLIYWNLLFSADNNQEENNNDQQQGDNNENNQPRGNSKRYQRRKQDHEEGSGTEQPNDG